MSPPWHSILLTPRAYHWTRIPLITSLGYCERQRLHPAFRKLADATSGQVIALSKKGELEQLSSLTGGSLDGYNLVSFGSNVSYRKKRSAGPAGDNLYSIPVDDSMEKMVVTVSTTRRNTNGEFKIFGRTETNVNEDGRDVAPWGSVTVKTVDSPSKPCSLSPFSSLHVERERP